eukprot:10268744-Alexandrium_andersonii.AAC.1
MIVWPARACVPRSSDLSYRPHPAAFCNKPQTPSRAFHPLARAPPRLCGRACRSHGRRHGVASLRAPGHDWRRRWRGPG